MRSEIAFGDEKLKGEFDKLDSVREKNLHEQLIKAFNNLREDA